MLNNSQIICPVCGELFDVSTIPPEDFGSTLDYDCEVCCRPLLIEVNSEGGLSAHPV